ncbi:hypothetical protein LTR37_001432 [Vermiconidia calcicola]|uniref:Uncharacterized protein n=1 Tax=Vermiconidia calcicola TaxID=1690605 RepID=A0ACC3NXG7_9PEZI|nr:hypothetical protein LTR37_001432 [Vermiconidia calcicola]
MDYPKGSRFAVSTTDNRQAGLWIASLLSLIYSIVILCARLVVKWGNLGLDDIALAGAYVLSLAHWTITYTALSDGLGKAPGLLDNGAISKIGQLIFTSRILFLTSLGLTKCTVILFVQQLFTKAHQRAWILCLIGGVVVAAWTLIAPAAISIGCHPAQSASTDAQTICPSEIYRWRIIAAIDCVLEVSLVASASYLISDIQINRKKKIMVMLAFAFRIGYGPHPPLGADVDIDLYSNALLMIAFLLSYTSALTDHSRPSIGITRSLVWQETLVAYALISATIPVLKGFLGGFDTTDLVQIDQSNSGIRSYRSAFATHGASSAIDTATRGGDYDAGSKRSDQVRLRPEAQGTATSIWHNDDSPSRRGSEDFIIHKTVEWEVRDNPTS